MDVVPDGSAEHGGVYTLVRGHRVIGEIVDDLEFLVEQLTDVRVQPVHQGEAVVLPAVVLATAWEHHDQTTFHLIKLILLIRLKDSDILSLLDLPAL